MERSVSAQKSVNRAIREHGNAEAACRAMGVRIEDETYVLLRGVRVGFLEKGINRRWFAFSMSRISWGDPFEGRDNLGRSGHPDQWTAALWHVV